MNIIKKILKKTIRISSPMILQNKTLRNYFANRISNAIEFQLASNTLQKVNQSNASTEKSILMTPIIGLWEAPLAFQAALSVELTKLGVKTKFLACDRYLPNCMADDLDHMLGKATPLDKLKRAVKCAECTASIKSLSIALDADFESLKDFKGSQNTLSQAYEVKQEHAISSTVRKTLTAEVGDIEGSQDVYKVLHKTAQDYLNVLVAYLTNNRPRAVVMIHGIYLEHGPIVQACQELNIPVYVYGFSYRNNTISITDGDTYHRKIYEISDEVWSTLNMTADKKKQLYEYLGSKISGGRDYVNYHPQPVTNRNEILETLNIDQTEPVLLFCTNVLWDATIYYQSKIYKNILESVFDTIEKCIEINRQLIIRIHPAESKGGFTTKRPFREEITRKFPNLPENIIIIDPESDISTYVLADISDIIINFASNIGLEFAVAGKRVVNLGNAFAGKRGFTIDPNLVDEYYRIIYNPKKYTKVTKEEVYLAEKFAYFWNFMFMTDIPQMEVNVLTTRETKLDVENLVADKVPEDPCNNITLIAKMINDNEKINYEVFYT